MNGLELIIDYDTALTPKQVAVFYDGLYKILDEIHIADSVDIVIEKGSLKSSIIINNTEAVSRIFKNIAVGASLLGALYISLDKYIHSKYQTNTEYVKNFTKEFNKPNFQSFKSVCNGDEPQVIYNSDNIQKKDEELKEQSHELIERIPVKGLQMVFVKGGFVKKKKNTLTTLIAKFDDSRYKDGDKIKIIIKNIKAKNIIKLSEKLSGYYFVADGTLLRDRGKYIEFELEELSEFDEKAPELSFDK